MLHGVPLAKIFIPPTPQHQVLLSVCEDREEQASAKLQGLKKFLQTEPERA